MALFDLSKDISERNDLSAKMPVETAKLRQRLDNYLVSVGAQMPTINPQFDPNQPSAPAKPKRGGQAKKPPT